MNVILFLIEIVWLVRILRNTAAFIELWWVKEYRFDRMRIHLSTGQGKKIYFLPFRGFIKTPKTILLLTFILIIETFLYVWMPFHPIVRLILLDIASFPLTGVGVVLLGIPQKTYHRYIIWKAHKKLLEYNNLLVVGITGSYGKTSTKEYLSAILSTQFRVLKTQASKNSLIGISEVVLKDLTPEHEIFVVEMGAYKAGEIADMTRMVKPQIGIIIGINEQHQSLFGSIENTKRAKYELIEGLSGKQTAVLNVDNVYVQELIAWAKRDKKIIWGITVSDHTAQPLDRLFSITHLSGRQQYLSFTISDEKESLLVNAPVTGDHQAVNIAAAIAGAMACGMTMSDAVKAAATITPVDKMMKPMAGIRGSHFVDNTFNNNPDAAVSSIEYLAKSKGKKILIFQPMIELGNFTDRAHERVGQAAGNICDEIILTNSNYFNSFQKGVNKNVHNAHLHVFGQKEACEYLRSIISSKDTVMFIGKESSRILSSLTK